MNAGDLILKLLGGILLASGFLIALLCGLCTGWFGIASVVELFRGGPNDFGTTGPFLVIGALATAIGCGMVWAGFRMTGSRGRGRGSGGGAP